MNFYVLDMPGIWQMPGMSTQSFIELCLRDQRRHHEFPLAGVAAYTQRSAYRADKRVTGQQVDGLLGTLHQTDAVHGINDLDAVL